MTRIPRPETRQKRDARDANRTQQETASRLGLTLAYLSMLERGRRPVTRELAEQAIKVFHIPPTAVPLEADHPSTLDGGAFKSELGALGYPGFSYLWGKSHYNPARLLFLALDQSDLDRRVVEAVPWLAYTYTGIDWEWLVRSAKLNDRQIRLRHPPAYGSECHVVPKIRLCDVRARLSIS